MNGVDASGFHDEQMFETLFPFIDTDIMSNDEFALIAKVEILFESPEQFKAEYGGIDATLSSRVKEIIEGQWGKRMEDVRDLRVGQLHERVIQADRVSYKPINSFLLQVQFFTASSPRRTAFTLA